MSSIILPDVLGTDKVGRGAGWRKTNVGLRCSQVLHDLAIRESIDPGELLGGMVESVIAFIQGTSAPSEWRDAGSRVASEIEKRMVAR